MNAILNSKACSGISPLRPGPGIGLLYSWLMGGGSPCPVFLEAVLATLPPELNLVAIIGLKWLNSRCPTCRDYPGLAVFSVNGLHVERISLPGNLESGQFQYRQTQNQHSKSPKAQLAGPQVSEDRAGKTLFVKTELLIIPPKLHLLSSFLVSLPSLSLSFRSPPHLSFLDCLHLTHHQILPRVIHTSPLCTVLLSAWPFPSSDCHCCSVLLGDPWTIVSSPSFPTRPSSRLLWVTPLENQLFNVTLVLRDTLQSVVRCRSCSQSCSMEWLHQDHLGHLLDLPYLCPILHTVKKNLCGWHQSLGLTQSSPGGSDVSPCQGNTGLRLNIF